MYRVHFSLSFSQENSTYLSKLCMPAWNLKDFAIIYIFAMIFWWLIEHKITKTDFIFTQWQITCPQ